MNTEILATKNTKPVVRNAIFTDWLQNGIEADCIEGGEVRMVLVDLIDYTHAFRGRVLFPAILGRVATRYLRATITTSTVSSSSARDSCVRQPSRPRSGRT